VPCTIANGAELGVSAMVGSATDDLDASDNAASGISAVENPAPVIAGASPSVTEITFRPHQMVPVGVSYTAGDACGPVATSLSVASSEPVTGDGQGVAGLTAPDWTIVDDHQVLLRSERLPTSAGRIYTITITAVDVAGQSTTHDLYVTVPRDPR
jgi:hypothetical protein